nr:aldehyde ferredoxin oxidoreductase, AOR {N-terminal} [Thermococcus, ES-1, Peptide Partial, 15 aa] [Thermococcus]
MFGYHGKILRVNLTT